MSQFAKYWFEAPVNLYASERMITSADNVAIYEGKQLLHEKGLLSLTNQRFLWSGSSSSFFMNLEEILSCSFDAGSWTKSQKILLSVTAELTFRLSFRGGQCEPMFKKLQDALQAKDWGFGVARRGLNVGIAGIQKNMKARGERTELNITTSFEDLSNLMASARDMVSLSQKLVAKSKEKNMTEDEFAQFRGQLLSIGIGEPQSGEGGDSQLQKEIGSVLLPAVEASAGMISLTEAYCRVNRARGLNLISPEDLLVALRAMKNPVKLNRFPSGLQVVQLSSFDEAAWTAKIVTLLREKTCLSAEQLATLLGTSAVLALERLLSVESEALACRDESVNGLVFYPNRFLEDEVA